MKMPLMVSQPVIYFCCKDALVGVDNSCSNCHDDNPVDAETKTACLGGSFLVLLLMDVPELHCQLWLWVSQSFGMTCLIPLIVFCTIMFIGAITNPGIDLTLNKGTGRLFPWMTSLLMSFLSSTGWVGTPLWVPKVSALPRACCQFFTDFLQWPFASVSEDWFHLQPKGVETNDFLKFLWHPKLWSITKGWVLFVFQSCLEVVAIILQNFQIVQCYKLW